METLNSHNGLAEKVDEIFQGAKKLRELTYSYTPIGDGKSFNSTIFIDYLGLPEQLKNNKTLALYLKTQGFLSRLKGKTENKLNRDIEILEEYLLECEESEKDTIAVYISALKFTRESLDFELEEAGYHHGLSNSEIQAKTENLQKYDAEIFGEHVSENPDFLKETYAYLLYQIEAHGSKLSQEHQVSLNQGLKAIQDKILSFDSDIDITEIPRYFPPQVSHDFEELSQIKISREDYARIFDIFNEVSGVPQRSTIGDFANFTDGDNEYGIPNSKAYEQKSFAEIVRLAPHETGHYINFEVTKKRGDGKRRGDIIKEEGLAKFTEALIQGIPIEKMSSISFGAPSVVLGNLLDGENFKNFEDAYLEVLVLNGSTSSKRDVQSSFLRKKRGFSKYRAGCSNKDAAYSLGMFSVLQYIKSGTGSIKNLFGGKISIQDVESGKFLPEDFGNKYISHIILSELIIFYLANKEKLNQDSEDLHISFVKHLKEKYKHFSSDFNLFNETDTFIFSNRKKVVEILKIIENSSQK